MSKIKRVPIETYPRLTDKTVDPGRHASLEQLYDFHVAKMEFCKAQCDAIIDAQGEQARLDVATGWSQLPYDPDVLAERYIANDLTFAKWSAKYKFHQARVDTLGTMLSVKLLRALMAANPMKSL